MIDGADAPITLRRVQATEAAQLRSLRLRALKDAPRSFASSFEAEAARPDSDWDDLARASALGDEAVVLVALSEGRWMAMVASRWFDRPAGVAQLWGMWVQPSSRGNGLGRALVSGIVAWAAERGARVLRLGVTEPAGHVATFYEQLGFERTGETKLLPPDGAISAFFLARPLRGDRSSGHVGVARFR